MPLPLLLLLLPLQLLLLLQFLATNVVVDVTSVDDVALDANNSVAFAPVDIVAALVVIAAIVVDDVVTFTNVDITLCCYCCCWR